MIKASTTRGDIILGLTEENINHMKEGKPVQVSLAELGMKDKKVVIMYGKDETAIVTELQKHMEPKSSKGVGKASPSPGHKAH